MPGEEWYTGETGLTELLDADDHDIWWTEAKRLQAIADEAATILRIDSPDVVHLCPEVRAERTRAERGGPARIRAIGSGWRWWQRVPRHFQLALARQVAAQPDSTIRALIGHEMAHAAKLQAPGRRGRQALVVATYVATVIALHAVRAIFSLDTWESIPVVVPAVLALVAWHSWLKRREELACDMLAASIGMPITSDAAAWMDDRYGGHLPRGLRWLVAPFLEHPSWEKRLDVIGRAATAPNDVTTTMPDHVNSHASTGQSP